MKQLVDQISENRTIRLAGVAVLVFLALFLFVQTWNSAFGRSANDPFYTITVEGTGRAAVIPDTARITFTVQETAATVGAAQSAAEEKISAAVAAVKDLSVNEKDVKTLSYNVSPKYEYPQPCFGGVCTPASPRLVGYDVAQTIEVRVRDIEKAGSVLEQLGTIGVQNISGPQFVADDESGVRDEAREEAVAEARAKAKELAKQLGVRLGKVVSFSENNPGYYDYARGGLALESAMPAKAPTLPVGENETEVTVMVTYEIR